MSLAGLSHEKPQAMFSVRQLLNEERPTFQIAGRAIQLEEFYRSHHFCGYCSTPMHISKTEWCCLYPCCHQRYYPQMCPSMIVAIRKDNRILLANHSRHRSDKLFTVLAGFVEVGESVEDAIGREVKEEANIQVKNVRYVGSQPWPFPNSLMLGYLAEYRDGILTPDKTELTEADWFHYTDLPQLPPYGTIAQRLIEDTIVLCRQYDQRHGLFQSS